MQKVPCVPEQTEAYTVLAHHRDHQERGTHRRLRTDLRDKHKDRLLAHNHRQPDPGHNGKPVHLLAQLSGEQTVQGHLWFHDNGHHANHHDDK